MRIIYVVAVIVTPPLLFVLNGSQPRALPLLVVAALTSAMLAGSHVRPPQHQRRWGLLAFMASVVGVCLTPATGNDYIPWMVLFIAGCAGAATLCLPRPRTGAV